MCTAPQSTVFTTSPCHALADDGRGHLHSLRQPDAFDMSGTDLLSESLAARISLLAQIHPITTARLFVTFKHRHLDENITGTVWCARTAAACGGDFAIYRSGNITHNRVKCRRVGCRVSYCRSDQSLQRTTASFCSVGRGWRGDSKCGHWRELGRAVSSETLRCPLHLHTIQLTPRLWF